MSYTPEELADELGRITYQPGVNLIWEIFEGQGIWVLRVERQTECSRTGEPFLANLQSHFPIPESRFHLLMQVRAHLLKFETHELDEFLKLDGEPVNPAHSVGKINKVKEEA